mgnify:CR=1 FL=1
MKFKNDVEIQNSDLTISNTGSAHLILNGDSNNIGDAGQEDAIIDFLGDAGDYGYRLNSENYSQKSAFNIQENRDGTYTSRLYIDKDGDVGIGTTDPDSNLEVAGSTGSNTVIHVRNDSTGSTRLKLSNSTDTDANGFQIVNNALNGSVNLLNYKATTLALWTNSSQRLTILSNGNVGIGTTSPSSELQVGNFGSAETPEIRVGGGTSSRITLNTGNSSGTFAQVGFGGSQYASENTAGKVKYTHITPANPALDIMSFRVNYSDRMVINGSGALELNNYTSTSYKTSVTPINPIQNFYPSSGAGSDTTTDLGVDQDGNVVRTTQEATWHLTDTQVDNITTGTTGTTLLSAPGAGLILVIEKVTFMIKFDYDGQPTSMSTTQKYEILQSTNGSAGNEVAVMNGAKVNNIACLGDPTGAGIYEHDTGYSSLNRTYSPNKATTIRRTESSSPLPPNVTDMFIKMRYRVYDPSTF